VNWRSVIDFFAAGRESSATRHDSISRNLHWIWRKQWDALQAAFGYLQKIVSGPATNRPTQKDSNRSTARRWPI